MKRKTQADGSIIQQLAFSMLEVKELKEDDDFHYIEGIASTPTPDRYGDIVEPMGAKFALPMPLLWQHDSHSPVGSVEFAKPNKKGIPFKASLPKVKEAGKLKDRIDEAVQSLKYRLVAAVSIGFRAMKDGYEFLEGGGIRFKEWEWLELSLVTIPANAEATITSVKSLCHGQRAALGLPAIPNGDGITAKSGATGRPVVHLKPLKKENEMNIREQIAALKKRREEVEQSALALTQKSIDEGRTFDTTEAESHDEYMAEIKSIDEHIGRLEQAEALQVKAATPVPASVATDPAAATQVRSGSIISVAPNAPKGTDFTRYVMALTRAKGNPFEAAQIAARWKDSPRVEMVLKAASEAGTTTDADWASKLVDYVTMADEFIELLRPMTILGKFGNGGIPGLRRVPFNIRMASQTGGGTYNWVGEGAAKPVGELAIGEVTLKWAKAAGIIVVTDELMRMSTPSVEAIVRQDMLSGMAQFSDGQFINPAIAAVTDVSPASITNGATNVVPASGTDAEALRTDIGTLLGAMFAANLTPTSGVWVMSNRQALRMSLMRNPLGAKEFPDMTATGGILEGFPVIASEAVPDDSDGGIVVFVNANDIFFSDDGPVTIDASREASLQMNTTPDNPSTASTVLVSLWQRNLIALKAERYMNWKLRRSQAVGYISGANYGS